MRQNHDGSFVRITLLNSEKILTDPCLVAKRFFARLKGWIGAHEVKKGQGIWFPHSQSVHMWFMRCHIDVVFFRILERDSASKKIIGQVTSTHSRAAPWRLLPFCDFHASDVVELAPGTIETTGVLKGSKICIESPLYQDQKMSSPQGE